MQPDSTAGRCSGSAAAYLPKWNFYPLLMSPVSGGAATIFSQLTGSRCLQKAYQVLMPIFKRDI